MPVRIDSDKLCEAMAEYGISFDDCGTSSGGTETICNEWYTTPSEDIWKKFGLDSPFSLLTPPRSPIRDPLWGSLDDDLDNVLMSDLLDCEDTGSFNLTPSQLLGWASEESTPFKREVRHDCMWAGLCPSEEHNKNRTNSDKTSASSQSVYPSCAGNGTCSKLSGGQSLLTSATMQGVVPIDEVDKSPRPETPVSQCESEDEVCSASSDGDSECSYPVSEVTGQISAAVHQPVRQPVHTTLSDHSYHLLKRPVKTDHLGVQTPSDSDEEIDVVSLGDRGGLPNVPNATVNQQLKLRVEAAAAASKTKSSSGVSPSTRTVKFLPCAQKGSVRTSLTIQKLEGGVKRSPSHHSGGSSVKRVKFGGLSNRRSNSSPRKRVSAASTGTSSDSEDSCERRSQHNNMERQRRIDLRNAFENLRVMVPAVNGNERAAKVTILCEAALHCHSLTQKDQFYSSEERHLQKTQEMLVRKLSQLRRSLART